MVARDRKRVLVVLDDDEFAATVQGVIDAAGFHPLVVTTSGEAHRLIEAGLVPCAVLVALTASEEGRAFMARHGAAARSAIPVLFFATPPRVGGRAPIVSALVAFVRSCRTPLPASSRGSSLH